MGLFDTPLGADESLFIDTLPLDVDFTPPIVKYRENEQHYIATCISPLLKKRSGKNLVVTGKPGIGKTVAVKHVCNELKKETAHVSIIYLNCWKTDTSYKIALDMCDQLGYRFVQKRDTNELFKEIASILNKRASVIILDEADKLTDQQALYTLLEDIFNKTLICITNDNEWISTLDERIRSRLMAELLEFKPYAYEETKGILKQRVDYALVPGVLDEEPFSALCEKTHTIGDIRTGLFLLKNAGNIAEERNSRNITSEDVKKAIGKLEEFNIKSTASIGQEENTLLNIIKQHPGKTTKDIYQVYTRQGGNQAYTTFYRKIKTLEKGKFITLKNVNKGKGRTTIIQYGIEKLNTYL